MTSKPHPNVVALSGYSRSGKDTFAKFLVDKARTEGHFWDTIAIADVLKRQAAAECGIDVECFYHEDQKDRLNTLIGMTPRQYLIQYGAKKRAEHGETYFIDLLCEAIDQVEQDANWPDAIIVTDVRYPVEQKRLAERYNVKTVRIIRDERYINKNDGSDADFMENGQFDVNVLNGEEGLDKFELSSHQYYLYLV